MSEINFSEKYTEVLTDFLTNITKKYNIFEKTNKYKNIIFCFILFSTVSNTFLLTSNLYNLYFPLFYKGRNKKIQLIENKIEQIGLENKLLREDILRLNILSREKFNIMENLISSLRICNCNILKATKYEEDNTIRQIVNDIIEDIVNDVIGDIIIDVEYNMNNDITRNIIDNYLVKDNSNISNNIIYNNFENNYNNYYNNNNNNEYSVNYNTDEIIDELIDECYDNIPCSNIKKFTLLNKLFKW